MSEITFPKMSDTEGAKGVIVTWFVENEEKVEVGDLLAEVAMDKVDMEIHAETAGIITILIHEETEVDQGATIARIE